MWKCPVCGQANKGSYCRRCGFDHSTDYEHHPTLQLLPFVPVAISQRQARFLAAPAKAPGAPKGKKKGGPVIAAVAGIVLVALVALAALWFNGQENVPWEEPEETLPEKLQEAVDEVLDSYPEDGAELTGYWDLIKTVEVDGEIFTVTPKVDERDADAAGLMNFNDYYSLVIYSYENEGAKIRLTATVIGEDGEETELEWTYTVGNNYDDSYDG